MCFIKSLMILTMVLGVGLGRLKSTVKRVVLLTEGA